MQVNVQCDKKARNKTSPLEHQWRFPGGQDEPEKVLHRDRRTVNARTRDSRGVLEPKESCCLSFAQRRHLRPQPQSAKKNCSHQVDTCRKASNRDNRGNRNSSVPQPKVESLWRQHTKPPPIRAFPQPTVVPQHRMRGVKKRQDDARDEANTSARSPAKNRKHPNPTCGMGDTFGVRNNITRRVLSRTNTGGSAKSTASRLTNDTFGIELPAQTAGPLALLCVWVLGYPARWARRTTQVDLALDVVENSRCSIQHLVCASSKNGLVWYDEPVGLG